jgi:glycosyltransferase involved in cell wall biosynthesis
VVLTSVIIIPAFQADRTIGRVVHDLITLGNSVGFVPTVLVVDDGSTDETSIQAKRAGATVIRHPRNQGKGAALITGFSWAKRKGYAQATTADADGQHPTTEIIKLARLEAGLNAIVLGVRNLARDGAPKANQFSNGISNRFLSWFTGLKLRDTQCGLRRYPIASTLALRCNDSGYAFEAEVLIRAARAGIGIEQLPITVYYPPEDERQSHFHVAKDPYRIVKRVIATVIEAS